MKPYKIRNSEGSMAASHALSVALNDWLTKHGGEIVRTCASCKHMKREGPAFCELYQTTPPIDVIAKACEKFDDESDIPF